MAPPAPAPSRARTHTLPDDRSLFLQGPLGRRKSTNTLPFAPASSAYRRALLPPTTDETDESEPTHTPAHTHTPTATAAAGSQTAPTSPASPGPAHAPFPLLPASAGPWSGTFLDAGLDTDADSDDSDDFVDAHDHPGSRVSISSLAKAKQATARDSFISILDDPFFQRYHAGPETGSSSEPDELFPPTVFEPTVVVDRLAADTPALAAGSVTAGHVLTRYDRASLFLKKSLAKPFSAAADMATVNIAVIGAVGVGKSAFIQRALRLPKPPTQSITSVRLDVDNRPFVVALIELDLEHFDVNPNQRIHWPTNISGHTVPHIDGALMLYDVMNKDSIRDLPPTLSALSISGLPTILVATKCDNPEPTRQINAEALATVFPSILSDYKTSAKAPSNTRDCLQTIVLAAVYNRQGAERSDTVFAPSTSSSTTTSTHTTAATAATTATTAANVNAATTAATAAAAPPTRRRAASSAAHLDAPPDAFTANGRPLSGDHSSGKHSRASSELSIPRGAPAAATTPADHRDSIYRAQNSRSPRIDFLHAPSATGNGVTSTSFGAEMTDEHAGQSVHGMLRSSGVRIEATHGASFLDTDESDGESLRFSSDVPVLQFDRPAKTSGTTLDNLVDRLLVPPMSRADDNFQDIFLCLYRKFATPSELLRAVIARLDATWADTETHFLERTATQFRYIEVVARWVSLYPGDFARPASRRQLEALVCRLANEPIFTASAHHIQDYLENEVREDDDTAWAMADEPADDDDDATLVGLPHLLGTTHGHAASATTGSMQSLTLDDPRTDTALSEGGSTGGSQVTSGTTHGGHAHGTAHGSHGLTGSSTGSSTGQFNSYDDYEREAATLEPIPALPLNKFRYHIFMGMDTADIAEEITRIDWIMFSSIRIRDLVRHVSLSPAEKEKCRSLHNTNRMIAHFNHVARWVSNMILIRDKAKHRAPCLQKFMEIAMRLRLLTNFNGLAAVLAGINGAAIHRLAATRALVDTDVQKRFARLVLLMSTAKSHFAYRLAWENSPPPRIPFMPLHRRDIVSAEEGSRTFVGPNGDRINWKKFEVLGEVLLPIMKSQGTPYPNLRKHQPSREMILDCRMPMDEDELYQRSVTVEPAGANGASGPGAELKKKFPWLMK